MVRFVLLLDLDCFYAQCECIRLGLVAADTALAVLQWDSVLAVTYPARKYGIKRGDGWNEVQRKHSPCWRVHVPVLTTEDENQIEEAAENSDDFERIYQKSDEEKASIRRTVSQRRPTGKCKASLEPYRIASCAILNAVHDWCKAHGRIILERASIDEFFVDVTGAVELNDGSWDNRDLSKATSETKCVGNDPMNNEWRRACWIGYEIRQHVFQTLGFTLTCGIGPNKTLAKLTASYGKPNGQAIVVDVPKLLRETKISKCRNLGGKYGKRLQALLPSTVEEPTLDAVRQHVAYNDIVNEFGAESAKWIFDLVSRGHDSEPVVPKAAGAAKTASVTGFKSFSNALDLVAVKEWFELVARDVVQRVVKEQDVRYPKTCTVHYLAEDRESKVSKSRQHGKSLRTAFPPVSCPDKLATLVDQAIAMIGDKEGANVKLNRIGVCASNFVTMGNLGSVFTVTSTTDNAPRPLASKYNTTMATKRPSQEESDHAMAQKLQAQFNTESRLLTAGIFNKGRKKKRKTIESLFQSAAS